jgi:hypothetical protein
MVHDGQRGAQRISSRRAQRRNGRYPQEALVGHRELSAKDVVGFGTLFWRSRENLALTRKEAMLQFVALLRRSAKDTKKTVARYLRALRAARID